MAEQTPRRERQDAVANRARILATAQDLFAREGVDNVSMNRIAHEAAVGTGTLYRHFANKSELCFALIQGQLLALAEELTALVDAADQDLCATLEAMVVMHQRFKAGKAPLFEGMQEAVAHMDGPSTSPVYEALRAPFVTLFEKAARAEGIDGPVDAVFRADVLLATLIGNPRHRAGTGRDLSVNDFAKAICRIFYPRA